jgi:hypothetical protein
MSSLLIWFKRRRTDPTRQTVLTYRMAARKPPVIQSRSFELFHRPRTIWTVAQILAFAILAVWTVKNYIHVLHSL